MPFASPTPERHRRGLIKAQGLFTLAQGIEDEGEMNEGEKKHVELVVARAGAPVALEPSGEPFHFVAAAGGLFW